jgi:hypothetical protein
MSKNFNTFTSNAAAVTGRDGEYTDTPFTDPPGDGTTDDPYLGGNRAGSNAPGIGINTGFVNPALQDWSILDQHEAARSPQDSQHIGGDPFVADFAATYPSSGGTEGLTTETPVRTVNGADVNNTLSFSVADAAAVPDAAYDTVTLALNRTGTTVAIGDRIWGDIPVA